MFEVALESAAEKGKQVLFFGLKHLTRSNQVQCIPDIPYGDHRKQKLDIYHPVGRDTRFTVLFIHGGSWQYGNKSEYAFIGQALAQRGIATLVMDYRLFPQASYPDFVDDVARVLTWFETSSGFYGLDQSPFFVMGHSAGAHIALLATLDPAFSSRFGFSPEMIKGIICLAGAYSFRPEKSALHQKIFPAVISGENYRNVKPVNFVHHNGIPLYLLHGRKDKTVACRSAERMYKNALLAGHPVFLDVRETYGHYEMLFDLLGRSAGGRETLNALEKFMQAVI